MKFNWKKLLVWSFSVAFVLAGVLVVHIYIVTRTKHSGEIMRQLSRIDFKQPIDSAEAKNIRRFVSHLEGVSSTYVNVPDHILIYTYVVGKQTSENVYNKLMAYGHYKAERYIVDPAKAKTGCPVIDEKSFTGKLSAYVSSVFK